MALSKVILNGSTLMDVTDTTAVAADVASGKYFYGADGVKTAGSAAVGGLEYETGTWTTASDINISSISFTNTHAVAPFYFMISDVSESYSSTTSSVYNVVYYNFHQLFGVPFNIDNGSTYNYGYVYRRYRNGATSLTGGVFALTTPYTDSSNNYNTCSRFWTTESGITAQTGNSEYWRAGRTYKWIAVWAPTT